MQVCFGQSYHYINHDALFLRRIHQSYLSVRNIGTQIPSLRSLPYSARKGYLVYSVEWMLRFFARPWGHQCGLSFYTLSSIFICSQAQLPSYNFTKEKLVKNGILPADSLWTYLASSSVSGACVVCFTSFILSMWD